MTTETRKWPLVVLTVCVVIAGAGVGGFFGALAGTLYDPYFCSDTDRPPDALDPNLAGLLLGAFGGGGAGALWSLAMRKVGRSVMLAQGTVSVEVYMRRLRENARRSVPGFIALGGGLGILAGALATVFLHAGLLLFFGQWDEIANVLRFQIVGVPAGLVTGLLCGFLAWLAIRLARRKPAAGTPAGEA